MSLDEAAQPIFEFEFAIIGALPYNAQEEAKLPELIAATDRAKVAFVVHNGDFKN